MNCTSYFDCAVKLRNRSSRNIPFTMTYYCDGSGGRHMTGLQSGVLHSKKLRHGYGLEGGVCLVADPKLALQFSYKMACSSTIFHVYPHYTLHATLYSINQLSSLLNPSFCGQYFRSISIINQSFAFLNHYKTFVVVDPVPSTIYHLLSLSFSLELWLHIGFVVTASMVPCW